MSDTAGDNSDGGSPVNSKRRGKRKILMRIKFDDSDEDEISNADTSDEEPLKIAKSANFKRNRILNSDNDLASSTEEVDADSMKNQPKDNSEIMEKPEQAKSGKYVVEDYFSTDSSDETLEKCPICLLTFRGQEIGLPESCEHQFCAICIEEWSKNVSTCPIDRKSFKTIIVRKSYQNNEIVRRIVVNDSKQDTVSDNTDLTFCEICNQSNREDVMLLCDGCNQGYHIFCLDPPLNEIPNGSWYCDNCFDSEGEDVAEDLNLLYEDLREMGVPSSRFRIREVQQPRIPRTRLSVRIRASVVARTRTTGNDEAIAGTSANANLQQARIEVPSTSRSRAKITRRKTRKRRTRRKRRTYVVEYDVNNFDEKFEIKTQKKYIRRRRSRKTKTGRRTNRVSTRRSGVSGNCRNSENIKELFETRSIMKPQKLSILGNSNALEYFSDDSPDELASRYLGEDSSERGSTSVQTSVRLRNIGPSNRRKGVLLNLDRSVTSNEQETDILSSIMDLQDRWLTSSRNGLYNSAVIRSDGSVDFSSTNTKSDADKVKKPDKQQNINSENITQAPMYPRNSNQSYGTDGGGNNNNNNRQNNQSSNYGNSGSGNTYGNYRGFSGSGGSGTNNGNSAGGGNNSFLRNFNQNTSSITMGLDFSSVFGRNRNRLNPLQQQQQQQQQSPQQRQQHQQQHQQQQQMQQQQPLQYQPLQLQPLQHQPLQLQPLQHQPLQPRQPLLQHPPQLRQCLEQQQQQLPDLSMGRLSNDFAQNENQNNSSIANNLVDPISLVGGGNIFDRNPVNIPVQNFPVRQQNRIQINLNPLNLEDIPLPSYGPRNLHEMEQELQQPPNVPPLAPPPWNNDLFRLAGGEGLNANDDDDNDADCPNFSVYSAASFKVARQSENSESQGDETVDKDVSKNVQEDEYEEKEEDLVQLGDDDEIPDAINNVNKSDSNDMYEPENPTDGDNDDDTHVKDDENNSLTKKNENNEEDNQTLNNSDQKETSDKEIVSNNLVDEKKLDQSDKIDESGQTKVKQSSTTTIKTATTPKKGVLELYDDSDWEEWNIDKCSLPNRAAPDEVPAPNDNNDNDIGNESETVDENLENEKEKQTESISEEEEDRSYTPLLDEKIEPDESLNDNKAKSISSLNDNNDNEKSENEPCDLLGPGIGGMDTELISEEEEILNEEQSINRKRDDNKGKNAEPSLTAKKSKKDQFKKISKNTKIRNYRDKDRLKPTRRSRNRSRSRSRSRSKSNNKENRRRRRRNFDRRTNKRKDIERYDVRNVIGQQRKYKDRYGRDTSRPPRSKSRSRSRSRRLRSRSLSITSKDNRKSFSISPSPMTPVRSSPRRRFPSPRRSRSRRRSPRPLRKFPQGNRRRSRSPLRLRSRSNSVGRLNGRRMEKPKRKSLSIPTRSPSRDFTPKKSVSRSPSRSKLKRSVSRSLSRSKQKRKRSRDRKKKRFKKRPISFSRSPSKRRHQPSQSPVTEMSKKKKRRTRSKTPPLIETAWSCSPPPPSSNVPMTPLHTNEALSWTPPLASPNPENLTVILKNKDIAMAKKKREKKKRAEKRRENINKKEKRKKRSELHESPVAPSKEVFASGDNILVSVSFNKETNQPPQQTTVVTLPPTREEIVSNRRSSQERKKQKKSKEKSQRRHKKTDAKPVAIIDLARSPFQVIAQSPRDIIVLTDSDHEGDGNEHVENATRKNSMEIQPLEHETDDNLQMDDTNDKDICDRSGSLHDQSFEMLQLGPKTPPEPPLVKFSLPTKSKQIKSRNPLHDEQEEAQDEIIDEDRVSMEMVTSNKIGPNTPPESGPCSPDAYDPFDPTKSPSITSSPTQPKNTEISDVHSMPENDSHTPDINSDLRVENRNSSLNSDKSMNPVDLVMALMNTKKSSKGQDVMIQHTTDQAFNVGMTTTNVNESCEQHENIEDTEVMTVSGNTGPNVATSIGNNNANVTKAITVLSNVLITSSKNQQRTSGIPLIASPPLLTKTNATQSQQMIGVQGKSIISKLPLPKTTATTPSGSRHNGSSGGMADEGSNEIESPYSPGSDDYEDLFEPPTEMSLTNLAQMSNRSRNTGSKSKSSTTANKAEIFDNLFGSTSPINRLSGPSIGKKRAKLSKKTSVKVAKLQLSGPTSGKIDDDIIKIFDDLPSSAVELQVKDKFLRKLNRQERVVEEVKLVLKPHYNKKHITKDDYKDILRRSVPKICHSRSGEINPKKIQNLIEAYVKKFRQRHKLGLLNTGQVSSASKCAAYLKKL